MTVLSKCARHFIAVAVVFAISALAASNGPWVGSLWAQSGATVSLTPQEVTVREGDTPQFTLTVSPAPEEDMVFDVIVEADVDADTADGDADDYTAASSVTVPQGAPGAETSSIGFDVAIIDDDDDEGTQEVLVVRVSPRTPSGSINPAYPKAMLRIRDGVCDRHPAVANAIVSSLSAAHCSQVSNLEGV